MVLQSECLLVPLSRFNQLSTDLTVQCVNVDRGHTKIERIRDRRDCRPLNGPVPLRLSNVWTLNTIMSRAENDPFYLRLVKVFFFIGQVNMLYFQILVRAHSFSRRTFLHKSHIFKHWPFRQTWPRIRKESGESLYRTQHVDRGDHRICKQARIHRSWGIGKTSIALTVLHDNRIKN